MIRYRNQSLMLAVFSIGFASLLHAEASAESYVLQDGKVRFVCEGPEVTVPAWGQFTTVEGGLSIDPSNLSKASGNIEVYMVSIRTDDAAWDTMFRRAGFLEIDDLPRSHFVLDEVLGPNQLEKEKWVPMKLKGRFMLHGKTRRITVPATARWTPADPAHGKAAQIRVRASFHITWDEYEIAMPTGSTRAFAGDGALIHADLVYAPATAKRSSKR